MRAIEISAIKWIRMRILSYTDGTSSFTGLEGFEALNSQLTMEWLLVGMNVMHFTQSRLKWMVSRRVDARDIFIQMLSV